ncbi:hypothetical protein [Alicyclobacillus sp. ALC3]|uniref:hypothetical protein n=1 Tax=Alicyclobacillus sp. ALC3 TaxID=2796143 RepID=UPI00237841A8|nr:hypothetical protein [Alicyclobacillus sp. ALC3]WDL98223.1 hypothetical protein JC200_05850 [Alicyclobacillus sp. ALC3]
MLRWIITLAIVVVLAGVWVWMFLVARRRQKAFDQQYEAARERREVFVLNKRIVKERGQTRLTKYTKFKNYQVVGRITVSQSIRGVQMNKAQNVTFRTTKTEYDKIQPNRRYKVDVAGNYIGYVVAPIGKPKTKDSGSSSVQTGTKKRSWFSRRPSAAAAQKEQKGKGKSAKDKA